MAVAEAEAPAPPPIWRTLLYGGAMSTAGATSAWLVWIFVRAVRADFRVLIAALIGGALGVAIHFVQHYLAVARAEALGAHRASGHTPTVPAPVTLAARIRAALGFALVLGALAGEHFAAHIINEIYVPFFASIVTLFPIGVLFAWAFRPRGEESDDKWIGLIVVRGLVAGVLAAVVAAAIHVAIDPSIVPASIGRLVLDYAAWWGLVAICLVFAYGSEWRGAAVGGMALALGVVVVVCLTVTQPGPDASRLSRAVDSVLGAWSDRLLDAPEVPSWFWRKAERGMAHAEAGGGHGGPEATRTAVHEAREPAAEAEHGGNVEGGQTGQTAVSWSDLVWGLPWCSQRWALRQELWALLHDESPGAEYLRDDVIVDFYLRKIEGLRRIERLCGQVATGLNSQLLRSFLVLMGFAVGLAFAAPAEAALRPRDYRSSLTRRADLSALLTVPAIGAAAIVALRLFAPADPALRQLPYHAGAVTGLRMSADGRLATSAGDGTLSFWNPESGERIEAITWPSATLTAIAIIPGDELLIATSERDGGESTRPFWEWNLSAPSAAPESVGIAGGPEWGAGVSALAAVAADRRVAILVGGRDGSARYYFRLSDDKLSYTGEAAGPYGTLLEPGGEVFAAALSPDWHMAAVGGTRGLTLWTGFGGDGEPERHLLSDETTLDVAFSPDGSRLLSSHTDQKGSGAVRVWDITGDAAGARERCRTTWPLPSSPPPEERAYLPVALAGDGDVFAIGGSVTASGGPVASLTLWRTDSCEEVESELTPAGAAVTSLLFTPGRIVSGSDTGLVETWTYLPPPAATPESEPSND